MNIRLFAKLCEYGFSPLTFSKTGYAGYIEISLFHDFIYERSNEKVFKKAKLNPVGW